MTQSMTAFARCEQRTELGELVWELRSVNHRFLEPSLRLPEELRQIETAVRERLASRLARGKIDVILRYRAGNDQQGPLRINPAIAEQLIAAADALDRHLGRALAPPSLMQVLEWPGVIERQGPDPTLLTEQVLRLLDQALDQLLANRRREGERLEALIRQRCVAMREQVARVRVRMPEVIQGVRERLQQRLDELAGDLDAGRMEQELVILSQRLDVDEEMDRLQAHLDEVEAVLAQKQPMGRRLDFLMQELNRETNTLGSKSSDLTVTQCSVEMKVLIEQMREQIQNIE